VFDNIATILHDVLESYSLYNAERNEIQTMIDAIHDRRVSIAEKEKSMENFQSWLCGICVGNPQTSHRAIAEIARLHTKFLGGCSISDARTWLDAQFAN
jgi:hypothetical protein